MAYIRLQCVSYTTFRCSYQPDVTSRRVPQSFINRRRTPPCSYFFCLLGGCLCGMGVCGNSSRVAIIFVSRDMLAGGLWMRRYRSGWWVEMNYRSGLFSLTRSLVAYLRCWSRLLVFYSSVCRCRICTNRIGVSAIAFIHSFMLIRTNTNVHCEQHRKKCGTERSYKKDTYNCPKIKTTLKIQCITLST